MPTVFGHEVGPTGGAQAIRDGAGYRTGTISIFPGSSPGSFTRIQPSMSQSAIQAAIDGDTTGKVWWEAGLYRGPWTLNDTAVFRLYTTPNQEHRFQTGPNRTSADTAIIQGSEAVTGWITGTGADAGFWYVTGQTQDYTSRHGPAGPDPYHNDHPPAGHSLEAFYRNGVDLYPAATRAAIAGRSDCYFFDRVADRAYLGVPPSSNMERLADFGFIFRIHVPNIKFKGGIFRHSGFAMIQPNTLGGGDPSGFRLEDAELCYGRINNLVGGSSAGQAGGIVYSHCTFHHGGRYNFNLTGTTNPVVEFCEMHHGNHMHFGNRIVGTFDEGSDKTLFTEGMIYRKNWMHDNDGPSAWPDTQCNNFTFEDNVCEDEFGAGIHYEQNNTATIRRNYFKNTMKDGNQAAPFDGSAAGWPTIGGWGYKGGGNWISVAQNVEIYDNWFFDCKHNALYIRQDFPPDNGRAFNLVNLNFHHNRVDHWDSASALEYMITYRDSRLLTEVPEPPDWTPEASDEPFSPYQDRANNLFNFNDYHVRAAGREATTGNPDSWFFGPTGVGAGDKNFASWRQGFIAQVPNDVAGAGVGSKGSRAALHDPNSNFSADLPPTPGGASVPVPAQETDTPMPVTPVIVQPLVQVSETDSAPVPNVVVTQPGDVQIIALVEETDETLVMTPRFRSGWSEVATATTLSEAGDLTVVVLTASETDSVFALEGLHLPQVESLEEAQAIAPRLRLTWAGPVVVTTLTTGGVTPIITVDIVQAEESDIPFGLGDDVQDIAVAQVEENDLAFAVTGGNVIPVEPEVRPPPGTAEVSRQPVRKPWRARVAGRHYRNSVRR